MEKALLNTVQCSSDGTFLITLCQILLLAVLSVNGFVGLFPKPTEERFYCELRADSID